MPLRRAFLVVNQRFATPALRAGWGSVFSNPVSGYLMLLRTRGRRTWRMREAPLGYVIVEGAVYCCAGFGPATAWLRNILAEPRVEVVLPDRVISGNAERVTDPAEWVTAYRALIGSLGLVGRMTVGRIDSLDDAALLERHGGIPVVRIRPTGVAAGSMDPGGRFWLVPWLAAFALAIATRRALSRRSAAPA
jgi:deazaflavin-dependent oxidoreductase (nitroreductase family)